MADFNPTAANILASLGVKGATVSSNSPGYVPVLDSDGKLSANLIPEGATQTSITTLSNVAFIDPYTKIGDGLRKGSIAAPYKSIAEAAANFVPAPNAFITIDNVSIVNYMAFILSPGEYTDSVVTFSSVRRPLSFFLIGLGKCRIKNDIAFGGGMSGPISGLRPSFWVQGINTTNTISISSNIDVTVVNNSNIGTLSCLSGSTLRLSDDSRVDSTNISTISYITDDAHVANTSQVPGATVDIALDRLNTRRIRVCNLTCDSSDIYIDSDSSYTDVSPESSYGVDIYDLRDRDRVIVASIKELFKRSKDIVTDTVTANTVIADIAEIDELRINSLKLGGYKLSVDKYGYLIVMDGSEDPPQPPEDIILIRDSTTGAIYMIGVSSGRMYIAEADDSSSDPQSVVDVISVEDSQTGYKYSISIQNGRMVITRVGG